MTHHGYWNLAPAKSPDARRVVLCECGWWDLVNDAMFGQSAWHDHLEHIRNGPPA